MDLPAATSIAASRQRWEGFGRRGPPVGRDRQDADLDRCWQILTDAGLGDLLGGPGVVVGMAARRLPVEHDGRDRGPASRCCSPGSAIQRPGDHRAFLDSERGGTGRASGQSAAGFQPTTQGPCQRKLQLRREVARQGDAQSQQVTIGMGVADEGQWEIGRMRGLGRTAIGAMATDQGHEVGRLVRLCDQCVAQGPGEGQGLGQNHAITTDPAQDDHPGIEGPPGLIGRDWALVANPGSGVWPTANGVADDTQIHTHMCYSEFNDIIRAIADMDADVITIETSRSDMELLDAFDSFQYPNEIGPGVYDIHSPNIPTQDHMVDLLRKAAERIPAKRLWVNPDCGLKTRQWAEVIPALANLVLAAQRLRGGVT